MIDFDDGGDQLAAPRRFAAGLLACAVAYGLAAAVILLARVAL